MWEIMSSGDLEYGWPTLNSCVRDKGKKEE